MRILKRAFLFVFPAVLIALGALAFVSASAAPEEAKPAPQPASAPHEVMNGYSLKQFGDFAKNWQLVTVRYRRDTGEMRFTYANPSAWQAMMAGKTDYPDGAVFAKIGILTGTDPAFESSAVPSGAMRYQLMVMDKKKHADMHGWGYAIFDKGGMAMDMAEPAVRPEACNACHELVPERGYVFSQPMRFQVVVPGMTPAAPSDAFKSHIAFATESVDKLPEAIRAVLPAGIGKVQMIHGDMEKYFFQGTINEIRPTLDEEAQRSGLPAMLVSSARDRFVLSFVDTPKRECDLPNGKKGVHLVTHLTTSGPTGTAKIDVCE